MNKNEYKSRFWAPKPGKINYIVNINRGIESYQVSSGTFEVQESHVELNRIYLNKEKLNNISISSGGVFKLWGKRNELLDKISNINERGTFTIKYKIRYNYLFILIFFLVLTLEWFLRRRVGLI